MRPTFKPSLHLETLREISARSPAMSDARVLLWEVRRLHQVLEDLDWYVAVIERWEREVGQANTATQTTKARLGKEPAVIAYRAACAAEAAYRAQHNGCSWGVGHLQPDPDYKPDYAAIDSADRRRRSGAGKGIGMKRRQEEEEAAQQAAQAEPGKTQAI